MSTNQQTTRSETKLPNWDGSVVGRTKSAIFRAAWIVVNFLLILSIFAALCSVAWEYSTRRYLKGFSDAIVPATAPDDEKVVAILSWMAHGPTRLGDGLSRDVTTREASDTLNYDALLRVCGTVTNAFINLSDSAHLGVRRLLLLDSRMMTKHVLAEVSVEGRWIVVDPAYHVVFRDLQGRTLTRKQLSDPATFALAIAEVPGFDPTYTFNRAVHLRLDRIRVLGPAVGRFLNWILPGWQDSTIVTLLLERESFAAVFGSVLLLVFTLVLRALLRWYGSERLGIQPTRIRERLLRAGDAFWGPEGGIFKKI